jgi:succinate-acetate transporter protein
MKWPRGRDERPGRAYDRPTGGYRPAGGGDAYDRPEGRDVFDRPEGQEDTYGRTGGGERGYGRSEGREPYGRQEGREPYERPEGRDVYERPARGGREYGGRPEGREGYERPAEQAYPGPGGVQTAHQGRAEYEYEGRKAHEGRAGRGGQMEEAAEHGMWQDKTRVFLQPIAAPSILGLFGLATALAMVGSWQAGWYGGTATPLVLFPFVLFFGGLAQLLAGMWSYRARDGVATAVHGMWGSLWLAFGLLFLLVAAGAFPAAVALSPGVANTGFAFWFIMLCVITGLCAFAALAQNMGMALTLMVLAVGAGFTAAGFWAGSLWATRVGGWLFVASAVLALYAAASLMFENSFGRTVLPTGKFRNMANMRGRRGSRLMEYAHGQPGVKIGQ